MTVKGFPWDPLLLLGELFHNILVHVGLGSLCYHLGLVVTPFWTYGTPPFPFFSTFRDSAGEWFLGLDT